MLFWGKRHRRRRTHATILYITSGEYNIAKTQRIDYVSSISNAIAFPVSIAVAVMPLRLLKKLFKKKKRLGRESETHVRIIWDVFSRLRRRQHDDGVVINEKEVVNLLRIKTIVDVVSLHLISISVEHVVSRQSQSVMALHNGGAFFFLLFLSEFWSSF